MDEATERIKNSKQAKAARARVLARYVRDADGKHVPGTYKDPAAR